MPLLWNVFGERVAVGVGAVPYFHATTRDRIESIQRRGLLIGEAQNFDCEAGVYLAASPTCALTFLLELALEGCFDHLSPSEAYERFCVIVIDGGRIDESLLKPDPQIKLEGFWIYPRTIDISSMPIIGVDDVWKFNPDASPPSPSP